MSLKNLVYGAKIKPEIQLVSEGDVMVAKKLTSRLALWLVALVAIMGGSGLTTASASALQSTNNLLPLPWVLPASPPLPPDMTIPYLAGVNTICADGDISCFYELEAELESRTSALRCSHEAIASDAYLTITRNFIPASQSGAYERPDRLNHAARQYAQEYLDQRDRWYSGDKSSVSPAWRVALQSMDNETQTGLGNLLLWLNAHIRRDNPIRAQEQAEGVLRLAGPMPEASGRADHDQISETLQDSLEPMIAHNAEVYDPTVDDGVNLFGQVMDPEGLYFIISLWREEAWRNAEQLRHARANGGVNGILYKTKLAQIEESSRLSALSIKAATLTTPWQNAQRNAHCEANIE